MKTLAFDTEELRALLDILSEIIPNTSEYEYNEDPSLADTHVFNFSWDQFHCLKNIRNEIAEFIK